MCTNNAQSILLITKRYDTMEWRMGGCRMRGGRRKIERERKWDEKKRTREKRYDTMERRMRDGGRDVYDREKEKKKLYVVGS